MITDVQPSSPRHKNLHSAAAENVRLELITWLEEEHALLNRDLVTNTDHARNLQTQGALQTLERILEPVKNPPRYAPYPSQAGTGPVL